MILPRTTEPPPPEGRKREPKPAPDVTAPCCPSRSPDGPKRSDKRFRVATREPDRSLAPGSDALESASPRTLLRRRPAGRPFGAPATLRPTSPARRTGPRRPKLPAAEATAPFLRPSHRSDPSAEAPWTTPKRRRGTPRGSKAMLPLDSDLPLTSLGCSRPDFACCQTKPKHEQLGSQSVRDLTEWPTPKSRQLL